MALFIDRKDAPRARLDSRWAMLRRAARPAVGALGRSFTTESSRAYRELLKAQRELFGEDYRARVAARLETRTQFMQNAGASESDVPGMVQDARDAAVFLRHNVAQTVRNDETGNFGVRCASSWPLPW